MTAVTFSLLVAFTTSGCQARVSGACGGFINVMPLPLVTLESVTPSKDSVSWGYPLFQFPPPCFPLDMLRAGITGEVVVRANVGADGIVRSVSVVRSTQREFEIHALAGVQRWRFVEFVPPAQRSSTGYTVDCLINFGFDES
ncbi:MAG: energy transducer TonB [Opitutaceae bacterium]|nr:energy transducer TonB [Opitutaceae bacterium]